MPRVTEPECTWSVSGRRVNPPPLSLWKQLSQAHMFSLCRMNTLENKLSFLLFSYLTFRLRTSPKSLDFLVGFLGESEG